MRIISESGENNAFFTVTGRYLRLHGQTIAPFLCRADHRSFTFATRASAMRWLEGLHHPLCPYCAVERL